MALEHLRPAVELTRAIGYRPGELSAMTALGDAQRLLDRHEHAAATYQYALAVAEEIGDRNWQFEALNSLGRLHHAIGQPERALADHLEALSLSLPHWASEPTMPVHATALPGPPHARSCTGGRKTLGKTLEILTVLGTEHTEERGVDTATIGDPLTTIEVALENQ
jgi:tetratricopeptide (TPR) repeat protein